MSYKISAVNSGKNESVDKEYVYDDVVNHNLDAEGNLHIYSNSREPRVLAKHQFEDFKIEAVEPSVNEDFQTIVD